MNQLTFFVIRTWTLTIMKDVMFAYKLNPLFVCSTWLITLFRRFVLLLSPLIVIARPEEHFISVTLNVFWCCCTPLAWRFVRTTTMTLTSTSPSFPLNLIFFHDYSPDADHKLLQELNILCLWLFLSLLYVYFSFVLFFC